MKKNSLYTIGSLVILLICAFVFVLIPAFAGSQGNQKAVSFGKYNNKEIRYEQNSMFADYVSNYAQMLQQYGQQLDSSSSYYIYNSAFNATVRDLAYMDYISKSGYSVSKSELNNLMRNYYVDETGKYSSKIYKQTSDETKKRVKKEAENAIITTRFYDDLFGSTSDVVGTDGLYGIKESSAELDFLQSFNLTKRKFNMAAFPLSDYPVDEKVKYGNENTAKFVKYDMNVITCEDKTTAEKAIKRIANGEITFEDAVSEYSAKTYSNTEGKLNYNYQYQIENILEDKTDIAKIAALVKDATSEVIKTNIGYTLFKANADSVQANFTSDDDLSILSAYLTAYESTLIEDYFTAKAKDLKTKALKADFADACAEMNVEKTIIEPFPLNYGNVSIADGISSDAAAVSGALNNENFLKIAFALKQNEISEPIVINNNIVVLQFTEEVTTPLEEATPVVSQITDYDQTASQSFIMGSPKLENNFTATYINMLAN